MLAHNVFFSLHNADPASIQGLVEECHRYLADHLGVVFYAAGTVSEINRPVSDRDYDVALHVVFTDRAAHDAYQAAPAHQEFIARNQHNWKKVRVFDSDVNAPKK